MAAVYGGGNLKLYLNGKLVITQAASGAIAADASLLTIGRNPATVDYIGDSYFKGKIDEVRVFNVALTDSQLQRMVYQKSKILGHRLEAKIVLKILLPHLLLCLLPIYCVIIVWTITKTTSLTT